MNKEEAIQVIKETIYYFVPDYNKPYNYVEIKEALDTLGIKIGN